MTVQYRKAFFADLSKIKQLQYIENIEFITEFAAKTDNPEKIPGFKWLRQYPGKARIEIAPFRIGVEVTDDVVVFKRILHRSSFYHNFP